MKFLTSVVVIALVSSMAYARCPNACSQRGTCGPNSQCKCFRNWQGSDCSERVCYYAHAFIDTPLGDLNADGDVDMEVVYNSMQSSYALEAYPLNYGIARDITKSSSSGYPQAGRWDEGHFYYECSNKGICDRKNGKCKCFPGYEGEGCQRTSCPTSVSGKTCSGHGVCKSAYADHDWKYQQWDSEKTFACKCDSRYTGPDCSLRRCPAGPDPVQNANVDVTSLQRIVFKTRELAATKDSFESVVNGKVWFTITVTDDYGDEFTTNSLYVDYATVCNGADKEWHGKKQCFSFPYDQNFKSALAQTVKTGATDQIGDTTGKTMTDAAITAWAKAGSSSASWNGPQLADYVNASLQALPNGVTRGVRVWTSFAYFHGTQTAKLVLNTQGRQTAPYGYRVNYPSVDHSNGYSAHFMSPVTRFPDFGKDDADPYMASCGNMGNRKSAGNVASQEGLCIFVSSENKITTNYQVTYTYQTSYQTFVGKRVTEDSQEANGLVSISDASNKRFWDKNVDGQPAKQYSGYSVHECSKRGVCDYETGECKCFAGYGGVSCSSQRSISYSTA